MKKLNVVKIGLVGLAALLLLFPLTSSGATYTVTSTADAGSGTLRWAISSANSNPGSDIIKFYIDGGPSTIQPLTALPPITDMSGGVFINGYSQPGAQPNTQPQGSPTDAVLMIEIDGSKTYNPYGIDIRSNDNTVCGLVINRFSFGVNISGFDGGGSDNHISGCYIGTDRSGSWAFADTFNTGVWMLWGAARNLIGGPDLADRNLISGWGHAQVRMFGEGSDNNRVEANYIGTEKHGTAAIGGVWIEGNGVSIWSGPRFSVITDNVISGNPWNGIELADECPAYGSVVNNYIGVDATGTAALENGRHGVYIRYNGEHNTIGPDNVIAFNGWDGVCAVSDGTDFNTITRNSIYKNGDLGIDLRDDGVSLNDAGDPDTGPNQGLNFPVITGAFYNFSTHLTHVSGTLDIDTDPTKARVEVFKADRDPTGYGEGRDYLGSVMPDPAGNWNTVVAGVGLFNLLTSTATDQAGNTSEFSPLGVVIWPGVEETDLKSSAPPIRFKCSPNPFNRTTTIRYHIAEAGRGTHRTTHTTLYIYDAAGRILRILVDKLQEPGYYSADWDGKDNSGERVSAGIYFYRLLAGDFSATGKAIMIR